MILGDSWQYRLQKVICAGIFETDAVQHSVGRFRDTYAVVSATRLKRRAFDDDSTQFLQIGEFGKFLAESERPGRGHDGRVHLYPKEINGKPRIAFQSISFFLRDQ